MTLSSTTTYPTSRFVVLGHDFGVRTPDPDLSGYIDAFFAPLGHPGEPSTWYELIDHGDGLKQYELRYEGETVIRSNYASRALMSLTWHVNQQVIRNDEHVILHAACADLDGVGVVVTGPMEAGKTTLATGLVERGLGYLTDEAVLIDPETLRARPYHKPLSIDEGSWPLFPHLRPDLPPRLGSYLDRQWQVSVPQRGLASITEPRVLIRTRYIPEAPTRLQPLSKVEMLQVLLEQTFFVTSKPRLALTTLGDLVRESDCYELTVSELDTACDAIIQACELIQQRDNRDSREVA